MLWRGPAVATTRSAAALRVRGCRIRGGACLVGAARLLGEMRGCWARCVAAHRIIGVPSLAQAVDAHSRAPAASWVAYSAALQFALRPVCA